MRKTTEQFDGSRRNANNDCHRILEFIALPPVLSLTLVLLLLLLFVFYCYSYSYFFFYFYL